MASAKAKTGTHAPFSMNASAEAAWRESSRVVRRTKTLVSTARISFPNSPPDSFFHLVECSRLRRLSREQRPMNFLRRKLPRSPHNHLVAVFLPLQNRTRTDTQLLPNFDGN